jgi:sulfur-oxidizing protein SoxB
MDRRDFIWLMSCAASAGLLPACTRGPLRDDIYDAPSFGNARLLHFTDCHAQLTPVHFREPNVNIGVAGARGRPPHLVGQHLLDHIGAYAGSSDAYAFTHLDFVALAEQFGKVGGFAYLKSLIDRQREEVGDGNSLLLDGGDTWQGSATALWTRGQDMVDACNMLGNLPIVTMKCCKILSASTANFWRKMYASPKMHCLMALLHTMKIVATHSSRTPFVKSAVDALL